jgi:hypothetical protein
MTKPKAGVKVPMGQRKSGLAVPADKVKQCRHDELFKRIKIPVNQYVCGDCDAKMILVVPQYILMPPEDFQKFQQEQMARAREARLKQETGLVTPDEVRREQQEGRKR